MAEHESVRICRLWMRQINDQNLDGPVSLASADHTFFVEGENPMVGRDKILPSWTGYFDGYPEYVVYEDELFDLDDAVYVVGHATGSHVPRELETIPSCVIWRCVITGERISEWSIYPATVRFVLNDSR